jgi:hypothetical protein
MLKCLLTFASACAFAITVSAQERVANSITDVTGTWAITIESHQLGLELDQKDTKVEGVLYAMGQRILLVGTFADRQLILKGEPSEDQPPSAKDNGAGPITATMMDDGTLSGELSTTHGRAKFTAERLKKP